MQKSTSTDDVSQFHSVDQTKNPAFFTRFMDTSHQTARRYQQEMIAELALKPGNTVLDVGCGAGQDTYDLVQAVGSNGRVVGIDKSETMLQEARARTANLQISAEYILADATSLPFGDASFDGCRASRVLSHLLEPELALAEMIRVARPGARIVVADGDLDLTIVEIPDRSLARKVIHAACDLMHHPWLGRQLPKFFQQAGLNDIRVDGRMMRIDYAFFQLVFRGILQRAQDSNMLSADELARFWSALEQAEQAQHFFAGAVGFIVSGQKSF